MPGGKLGNSFTCCDAITGSFDSTVYSSGLSGIKESVCFTVLGSEMPIGTSRPGGDEGEQVTRFEGLLERCKRFDGLVWEGLV